MKRIAVFFNETRGSAPFGNAEFTKAYQQFGELLRSHDALLYIVRGKENYAKENSFRSGWIYKDNAFEKIPDFTVDVIYNKGTHIFDDAAVVCNEKALTEVCEDKFKVYELFPEICPRSVLIRENSDIASALSTITSDTVVVKPLITEGGGRGVWIGKKSDAVSHVSTFPSLVQSFIDTSAGIPGITDTVHDFRIVVIDGTPLLAFVRTPAAGSLIANVALGATVEAIPLDRIPPNAMAVFQHVDAVFSKYPHRIYTVDMGRNRSGKWYLIEINSQPALFDAERGTDFKQFQFSLATMLLSLA